MVKSFADPLTFFIRPLHGSFPHGLDNDKAAISGAQLVDYSSEGGIIFRKWARILDVLITSKRSKISTSTMISIRSSRYTNHIYNMAKFAVHNISYFYV